MLIDGYASAAGMMDEVMFARNISHLASERTLISITLCVNINVNVKDKNAVKNFVDVKHCVGRAVLPRYMPSTSPTLDPIECMHVNARQSCGTISTSFVTFQGLNILLLT